MNKFGWVILGIGLLVSGCSEDIELNDVNASEQTEIKDTIIEEELELNYYEQISLFNNDYVEFLEDTYPIVTGGKLTDSSKEKLIDITNDFILYLSNFNPVPVTTEDEKFDEHLKDLIYDLEQYSDYALQYAFKEEDVYKRFVKDHFENIRIHLSTLTELEKLYY